MKSPQSLLPEFLFPLRISRMITPKLNTSDLMEKRPSEAYSGAIQPLKQYINFKLLCMVDLYIDAIKWINFYDTYYVPTTLLVAFPSGLFELNIFASPKSEILGFISLSKRMLLGLRSRCMTRNLECLCRQRSPSAIPSIITRRLLQSSKDFLFSSAESVKCLYNRQQTPQRTIRSWKLDINMWIGSWE